MNWYIRIYLVTQIIKPVVLGYYHELSKLEITHKTLRNDSYFGFSLSYDQNCKKLIVSAPRETSIGEIYRCDLANGTECINKFTARINRNDIDEIGYLHDFWFGASMKVGRSGVIACAPLLTKPWNAFVPPAIITKGSCYMEPTRCSNNMLPMHKTSADDLNVDTYNMHNVSIADTYSSLGWSIDIEPYSNTIVVGGPAMYTGRVAVYSSEQTSPILLHRTEDEKLLPTFNMGYSVAGIHRNGKLQYAVGSPYGRYGEGGVYFFNKHLDFVNERHSPSTSVGSMYGAVICSANVFGNSEDLFIGAPTYATRDTYNLGAVYIYEKYINYRKKIVGPKDGSYFGSAIITLGDLNGDHRDEIAISAPHEDGRGAVYIYSGMDIASTGDIKYVQRIQSERYTSFGMSLAAITNFNNIGCNELAVGSPYDDVVVMYPCIASIKVEVKAKFPNLKKRRGKTDFFFDACLHVTFPRDKYNNPVPENIVADVSTRVHMVHPTARLKGVDPNNVLVFNQSLNTQNTTFCTPIGFILPDGNYNIKIGYSLTSHLITDPRSVPFDKSRVLLNDHSILRLEDFVSAADCNSTCIPNLNMTFGDSATTSNPLSFTMTINNVGDVAYDACITLVLPFKTVSMSPECVHVETTSSTDVIPLKEGDTLRCVPRKLLRENSIWQVDPITLDNRFLTSLDRNVTIQAFLFNDCSTNVSKAYEHLIRVKGDPSGVNVSGETNIGELVEMTKIEIQTDGKKIEHHYTITNHGKTVWVQFNCILTLPINDYVNYSFPVTLQYLDTSTECSSAKEGSGFKVTCVIGRLPPEGTVKAIIPIEVLPKKLENIVDGNVTVASYATIHLDETIRKASIITVITKMDDTVDLWVIIVATIVGFLILCLIVFIFYKCGGFRRKNKENLHALRNSVRRQTIRRSMNVPKDDQRQIIEESPEENGSTLT